MSRRPAPRCAVLPRARAYLPAVPPPHTAVRRRRRPEEHTYPAIQPHAAAAVAFTRSLAHLGLGSRPAARRCALAKQSKAEYKLAQRVRGRGCRFGQRTGGLTRAAGQPATGVRQRGIVKWRGAQKPAGLRWEGRMRRAVYMRALINVLLLQQAFVQRV